MKNPTRPLLFILFGMAALVLLVPATKAPAADASPVSALATDGTGFKLKDRFNEIYAGQVTAKTTTYATTVNLDFAAAAFETVTLTGNVTFTTSHLVAGRTHVLRLIASGGSRTLTLPAGWVNTGAAAPTAVASGKTGVFVLRSFGTADSAVVYRYEVQP